MEFNVFEYFKGYKRTTNGPMTPEEQGASFFLAGHMGERITEHVDVYAAKAGMSRRNFLGTASGFAAAMLAVNQITGMTPWKGLIPDEDILDIARYIKRLSTNADPKS